MRLIWARLTLGVALLLSVCTLPAVAGGWSGPAGGLKDYGSSAVPVPAPMPIPVFEPQYYFRADFGYGVIDDPAAHFTSDAVTDDYYRSFDNPTSFGLGVGYRFGNGWRMDLTGETRGKFEVRRTRAGGEIDDVTGRGGVFFLNLYRDFENVFHSRLTPYVGAGLGLALNDFKRQYFSTTETIQDKTQSVSLAANAMVGASYRLNESLHLDVNYRFMYIDGGDFAPMVTAGVPSELHLDSIYSHEVRAGLRFDVN